MADTSVVAGPLRTDGSVPYELGKPNWETRTIPNIRNPSSSLQLGENRVVDVLILGDGYLTQAEFEAGLQSWIDDFYDLKVYDVFRGAFRIRALYRQSPQRASADRDSFYRVNVTDDDREIPDGSWWDTASGDTLVFRRRVFEDVDSFVDINRRRYPTGLSFGESNTAIGNWLFGMYRNLIVSILVRTASTSTPSGRAFRLARLSPNEDHTLRVATGFNAIHEFSHAFGLLSDEYIEGRSSQSTRSNPTRNSVLTLSNLIYSDKYSQVPWFHLSPWGRDRRQASGGNSSPVLGWIWVGGKKHRNVWHSEYRCLMNGTHDNFQYTQDGPNDPTAQPDGSYIDNTGANLRDRSRFCLWCQELVTLRVLERTDQLDTADDPESFIEKGQRWYERWTTELRDNYWPLFNVSQQIADRENTYAGMNVGPRGEALETSDLYSAFAEDAATVAGASSVDPGEWLVLLG
jgi:hypothetical protein